MKTVNKSLNTQLSTLVFFLLASLLVITSCKENNIKMNTIVNEDGTCRREVSYSNVMTEETRDSLWKGDSPHWSYPIPAVLNVDSMEAGSTDIVANKETGDTVTTCFYRDFNSVEEMSQHTPLRLGGVPLKSSAKLEKRFRWFYTEYVYSETFQSLRDRFSIMPEEYADSETVKYWFTGTPNIVEGMSGSETSEKLHHIEEDMSKWINHEFVNMTLDYIENHYDSIKNAPVSKEEFICLKDSFTQHAISQGSLDISVDNENNIFHTFFHSNAYDMFLDDETPCGAELSKKASNLLDFAFFNTAYTLQLPGSEVKTFSLKGEHLIPGDYTITATSRVTNIWAWIVSVLIVFAAIALILGTKKYRKIQVSQASLEPVLRSLRL